MRTSRDQRIGLFVATVGYAVGFDNYTMRIGGAAIMLAVGTVLVVPRFQMAFAGAAAPLSDWANARKAGHALADARDCAR